MSQHLSILITTGIYPPEIGGPAQYAQNLKEVWVSQGHHVSVKVFSKFNRFKTGVRHLLFFFHVLPAVAQADVVYTLDTFSAALPTPCACLLVRKKIILRTGGDFLWEQYVERTKEKVLLKDFYRLCKEKFSLKEKITFSIIQCILQHVSCIIWTTSWQRDIFMEPYVLHAQRHVVIENYYGERVESVNPKDKNFIGASRSLVWKNIDMLHGVFTSDAVKQHGGILDLEQVGHERFLQKIKESYAVIIVSLGDISPNTILDAILCGKPFIVTRETGLYDRIKDIALFVDPLNEKSIEEKVLWLLQPDNYQLQSRKVRQFSFTHTWYDIASEYLTVGVQ